MRNMAVLHSSAFSYPLPVLVRVLFNLLIFKGKVLCYNKYMELILLLLLEKSQNLYNLYQVMELEWTDELLCCNINKLSGPILNSKSIMLRLGRKPSFS